MGQNNCRLLKLGDRQGYCWGEDQPWSIIIHCAFMTHAQRLLVFMDVESARWLHISVLRCLQSSKAAMRILVGSAAGALSLMYCGNLRQRISLHQLHCTFLMDQSFVLFGCSDMQPATWCECYALPFPHTCVTR